jgi:hypothetical protein
MDQLPKHHYVPVFYLKQWALLDKKVYTFKRVHGGKVVVTPKPPTHTGYHRGLYWLEGADPEISNRIETILMGRIDSNAAIAHQIILNDKVSSLSKEVRYAWARFVIGLLLRTPAQMGNVYKRMTTPGSKEYKELEREFRRDYPGKRYRDIPEDVMKRAALITTARLMQNAEVETALNNMLWCVYDIGLPELRFFTSDRPVVMTNGIGTKGGHLVIPISPRLLFLAFRDEKIRAEVQVMSPWEIHENVNRAVVRNAIDRVWDTDAQRLTYVQENMSAEAENDRNFFDL